MGEVWLDPAAAIAGPNRDTPYARLAQATKTVAGWYASNTLAEPQALDLRIEAGRPAAKAHLVTPLSSAVVLETKEQYQKHGLDDEEEDKDTKKDGKPKNDEVTASPEPGTLLLFAAGLTVAGIGAWRRRRSGSLSRGG
ncbi:MAG: PEP-CTERM sorting domain-containing protein [Cytophagales bacterium]|nr:PEP-CTERM sorting domain-containing protein [Armatimonadota bacterium]